jgi:replication-associated recombination protein RarA
VENARQALKEGDAPNVPLHLRNAPTKLMKAQGYHKGYRYPHSFENHFVKENYFPGDRPALTFINRPISAAKNSSANASNSSGRNAIPSRKSRSDQQRSVRLYEMHLSFHGR